MNNSIQFEKSPCYLQHVITSIKQSVFFIKSLSDSRKRVDTSSALCELKGTRLWVCLEAENGSFYSHDKNCKYLFTVRFQVEKVYLRALLTYFQNIQVQVWKKTEVPFKKWIRPGLGPVVRK